MNKRAVTRASIETKPPEFDCATEGSVFVAQTCLALPTVYLSLVSSRNSSKSFDMASMCLVPWHYLWQARYLV